MREFKCTCGADKPSRIDSNRQVFVKRELRDYFVDLLLKTGYREVRDPAFSQGRGIAYLVKNTTGESNRHFILWHLIFEEIKRYTDEVKYHLTRGPDVEFTSLDGRRIAVEVEATKKNYGQMERKLKILKKYDGWFIVVAKSQDLKHYQGYGPTFTRTKIQNLIAEYFKPEPQPEPKTKPQPLPKPKTEPYTNSSYLYQQPIIPIDKSKTKRKRYTL
ncbi:MAG: hypothetical protein GF416_06675 [Candidatus Altiarchaeales archaeon]|nr:hypothetical protein [Candidatus Altiarchaeales archaeon]MBD3416797.1 hypothetical protein [Candidatus Altiarchaeales archaeon]